MTEPTPAPAWQPGDNPKAAAKAAKAFAKASRPWYKKKRFILPLALVVLFVIVQAASGEDSSGPTVVDESTTSDDNGSTATSSDHESGDEKSDKAKAGSKDNPVKVGKTIELEGTRYTVADVETTQRVGSEYLGEDADGTFVIVTLTIENTKDETKTFSDSAAKLVGSNGKSYSTDSDGTIAAMGDGEEPLWLADMQPDLPKTGRLVFDLPPAAVQGSMLEVSDLFGKGEAYIKLGL